jgi:transcriptional regulator with XRE-family HTH domain
MSEPAFGELIRRGREKVGVSQARLAELIGKSPSTLRSWEHDRSRPSDPGAVKALAAVLDLEETELMAAAGFTPGEAKARRPTLEQELASLAPERTVLIPIAGPPLGEEKRQPAEPSREDEPAESVPPPVASNGAGNRSRKVTTVAPPLPAMVQSASYLEDREEKEFYWRRWAATGVGLLFLAVVLVWALDHAGSAIGDFIGEIIGSFNI